MYKVFADFHHASLLNSLVMLFEGRLGGELFRPIGLEWYQEGFWKVYDHPDTADQYLKIDATYKTHDGTPPLNDTVAGQAPGVYLCRDIDSGGTNKAVTFEAFKQMKFDILIASMPQHVEPFKELIRLYQPDAKLIFQIGNAWNIPNNAVKNVMASARCNPPVQVNYIEYHQEFDTSIFRPTPVPDTKKIYSFQNCLGVVDLYKPDWELFLELERLMPDWEFKSFGGQTRDGSFRGSEALASKMREATFVFHCKTGGDGYGHVIHNAAAVGRPLITRQSDYEGKLAEPLIDLVSCIIVDHRSPEQIAKQIETDYETGQYRRMGEDILMHFKEEVDFDKEEQEIRKFLDVLQ